MGGLKRENFVRISYLWGTRRQEKLKGWEARPSCVCGGFYSNWPSPTPVCAWGRGLVYEGGGVVFRRPDKLVPDLGERLGEPRSARVALMP